MPGEREDKAACDDHRVEAEQRNGERTRLGVCEPTAEGLRDGDREDDPDDAEDPEPDDRIEATQLRQADVLDQMSLPEPVVALAPHAGEGRDTEDREEDGPSPDDAGALATGVKRLR